MALAVTMFAALVSVVLFPAVLIALLLGIMCMSLLMRNIDIIVPFVFYEIDRMATGIVLTAVLAPVLRMSRRHVQVNRLIDDACRSGMNDEGSCVNNFGMGKTPDVNAAVKARLGNADGHPNIGGK